MSLIGWSDVGKEEGSKGAGVFLSLKDGDAVTFRVIDEGIKKTKFHQISGQNANGDDVFRSIMQTEEPDEDYIDKMTNRFPAQTRYAVRVVVYDDDGQPDEIRVLMGGVQIFGAVQKIFQRHGDPRLFDLTLSREGSGRDTEWSVTAAPTSYDLDVEEWVNVLDEDVRLSWDSIFPPISPSQQKEIIEESGIDISFDPIAVVQESMSVEKAKNARATFGKYGPDKMPPNGKTAGEIWKIDQGWIMWVAANATRGDENFIAACRVLVDNTKAIDNGGDVKEVTSGKKTNKKSVENSDSLDKDELKEQISELIAEDDLEPHEIVQLVSQFGKGKKRLRDLTEKQMQKLLAHLIDE